MFWHSGTLESGTEMAGGTRAFVDTFSSFFFRRVPHQKVGIYM
jgi:hypothetical protein